MRFAVPGRVQTGVVESEIGGEVDHVLHAATEIGNHRLASTVQTEEDEIGIGDDRYVVASEGHVAVGGGERGYRWRPGSRPGVAGGRNDRKFGMRRADAQQFAPVKPDAPMMATCMEELYDPSNLCATICIRRERTYSAIPASLVSRYSKMPWPSRPRPESFMPPKGAAADVGLTSLIPMMPNRSPSIARIAVERSLVYT